MISLPAIKLHAHWRIERFLSGELKPYNVSEFDGNLALNEGLNELWSLVAGDGGAVAFDNTNAYIGVGDSATAAAASQTGLQAAANKLYAGMEASYPQYGSNQQIIFRSVFGSADANWDWNEFTVANGNSDSDVNLDRKVSAQGTKAVGQTWTITLTITAA